MNQNIEVHNTKETASHGGKGSWDGMTRPSRLVFHQGCAVRYPGNSLPAIQCAVSERAPIIEIDVRPSKDGELYLFHDRRINLRAHSEVMCSQEGCASTALSDLNSEEIDTWRYIFEPFGKRTGHKIAKGLDSRRGGQTSSPDEIDTLRILKFDDLLDLHLGESDILLDMKGDDLKIAKKILEKTKGTGLEKRLIFSCGRGSSCLEDLKKISSAPRVLFRAKSPKDVLRALPARPEIIQIDKDWSSPELEEQIRAAGVSILLKALNIDYLLVDR